MAEAKPLASLSSGLLARKGAARPAMRRQPLGSGIPTEPSGYDDLGWNDMGYDVDPSQSSEMTRMVDLKPMLTNSLPHGQAAPHAWHEDANGEAHDYEGHGDSAHYASPLAVKPVVVQQQEELAQRVSTPIEADDFSVPQPIFDEAAQPDFEPEAEVQVFEPAPISEQVRNYAAEAAVDVQAEAVVVAAPVSETPIVAPSVEALPIRRAPRAKGSAQAAREKAAFTLRLDGERHLRLRLASAVTHRSAQMILIDLLDDYLAALPEIDAMASRLPTARANRI